jgi:hypothetical protein
MFCEGPHDAAFLNRLLKTLLGFQPVLCKPSELPYPIGDVLKQSFKTRAAEDLRLDLAKKFFLPDYTLERELERERVLVLVFNYGGSNRARTMPEFLEDVFTLLQATAFSGGSQIPLSYAVFADADVAGTVGARNKISTDLRAIGSQPWLTPEWTEMEGIPTAAQQDTEQGRAAAYIWRCRDTDQGTLEDIVLECLSGQGRIDETLAFVDARFDWTPPPKATPEEVCALAAKRLKATFCVEGQRKKPGGSLAVVLDQAELLTAERLTASASVKDCVAFLRGWLERPVEVNLSHLPTGDSE